MVVLVFHTLSSTALEAESEKICAYPISGQYGIISRWLYYILIFLSFCARKKERLVTALFGVCMLYSTVAVLHGIALAVVVKPEVVDLDIIPVFAIVATGYAAAPPILFCSKTLQKASRSARGLFVGWLLLITAGLVASIYTLFSVAPTAGHSACDQSLPMRPTYNVSSPIVQGGPQEIVLPWGYPWDTFHPWMSVFCSLCGVSFIFSISVGCEFINIGGEGVVFFPSGSRRGLGCLTGWALIALFIVEFTMQFLLAELHLYKKRNGDLAVGEPLTSVGQWAPAVGAGLILIPDLLDWIFPDPKGGRYSRM